MNAPVPSRTVAVPDNVDTMPPTPRLLALGIQHVLVMDANAIAVPLIVGGALKLPKDQIALLVNADLFACGIATLIQTIGISPFGIRMPVIMGVTAVAIQPLLAVAAMPGVGLDGIYGAVIVAGLFGLAVVPFIGRLGIFPEEDDRDSATIKAVRQAYAALEAAPTGNGKLYYLV